MEANTADKHEIAVQICSKCASKFQVKMFGPC